MYISIIYYIKEKKSEIINISNQELEALNSLINKSAELSKDHKVNVIDKRTIHVYASDIGYITSAQKLSHILELIEYEGEIIVVEVVE